MSFTDSAYKNLLFGVSQQIPQDRLPGQVQEQLNMWSDLVTGPRRRPGAEYIAQVYAPVADFTKAPAVHQTFLNGVPVVLQVYPETGDLLVSHADTGAQVAYFAAQSYLTAVDRNSIRFATVDDRIFIANTEEMPTLQSPVGEKDPKQTGYFYVQAGQFSRTFGVTFQNQNGGATFTFTYTTPDGTTPGDATLASPENIAEEIRDAIIANGTFMADVLVQALDGPFFYIQMVPGWDLVVSNTMGPNLMRTSGNSTIRSADELPAKLPSQASEMIMATGTSKHKVYYKYSALGVLWVESAAFGEGRTPINMPRVLQFSGSYTFGTATYEARPAGNSDSNPAPEFFRTGITGMSVFQGRLVILGGESCCMSGSNEPLIWFRASITGIADNDPVEVAAQGGKGVPYERAAIFNKDLVLFAATQQAVVPGGSVVTPRTVAMSVTTSYDVDTNCDPAPTGRTVLFGSPRSQGFFGVHEMTPSPNTESYYVADDVTDHLPTYIAGPLAGIAVANSSGIAVVHSATAPKFPVIHQYKWSGGEKQHFAWHRWSFQWDVLGTYFSGDRMMALVKVGQTVQLIRVDLRALAGDAGLPVPKLDYWLSVTADADGRVLVPDILTTMAGAGGLIAYKTSAGEGQFLDYGDLKDPVDAGANTSYLITGAVEDEVFVVGARYESWFGPTSPVLRDFEGKPITTSKAVLVRYRVAFGLTGPFTYEIGDKFRTPAVYETTPLRLFSQNLDAGLPLADAASVTLPARVDCQSASLLLKTDSVYDLNVQSIEYSYRYHQRYKRA